MNAWPGVCERIDERALESGWMGGADEASVERKSEFLSLPFIPL
jgi:hypothetical protein